MTEKPPPAWFAVTLTALVERRELTPVQTCALMNGLLSGECTEAQTAALLVALRMKGETVGELAAAAAVMREAGVAFPTGRDDLLDTCGTGGDGLGTFNISTATALVVAGTGVPVVKHGNRAVSSRSGSADVLAELGVCISADATTARVCLDRAGMAFLMAPLFHPALKYVAVVRRQLGVRTIFNCLGPLANPAGASYQLLGIGRPEWLDRMAGALARLGTRRALLVCGADGLDEVSLAGPTWVREVRNGAVKSLEWTPRDFDLSPCGVEEFLAEGPAESAVHIRGVLAGNDGPARRVVLANAAAALLAACRVETLRDGVTLAAEAIASGRAAHVLDELVAISREYRAHEVR
jgi:anthranilate phosphoribosyltransferase